MKFHQTREEVPWPDVPHISDEVTDKYRELLSNYWQKKNPKYFEEIHHKFQIPWY
jgi:hypothetical protein